MSITDTHLIFLSVFTSEGYHIRSQRTLLSGQLLLYRSRLYSHTFYRIIDGVRKKESRRIAVNKIKDPNKKDSPLIFYIFYFVVFFGNAIQGSFLTLYLTNAGLPQSTVGLLNGITQCLSLIVLPLVGRLADKAPTKNKVLCIELVILHADRKCLPDHHHGICKQERLGLRSD